MIFFQYLFLTYKYSFLVLSVGTIPIEQFNLGALIGMKTGDCNAK